MSELIHLRHRMRAQFRRLYQSGQIVDGPSMRERWGQRFIQAILPRSMWRSEAAQFIRGKIAHEISATMQWLKKNEGMDFAADYFYYSDLAMASEESKDSISTAATKRQLTLLDEFNRKVEEYQYSETYLAMLDGKLEPTTQRKREYLDLVVRNS